MPANSEFKPSAKAPSPARLIAVLALVALVAVSCRVQSSSEAFRDVRESTDTQTTLVLADLPVLGPTLTSHWHGAYIVRICDDVLDPFESDDDPDGIHSHQDGLIHVHPFFDESAYERATLGVFAEAVDMQLSEGELTVPGAGTWRDGDLCGDQPGRVFVDKWVGPDSDSEVTRYFTDLDTIRFEADRELYQIGFAPVDSPPVVPPSRHLLDQVTAAIEDTDPWVDLDSDADRSTVRIWSVAEVTEPPCTGDAVEERVLWGTPGCFVPGDNVFDVEEAFASARAVSLNRQPAVDVELAGPLKNFLMSRLFANADDPLVLAIEVDGGVVTAPRVFRIFPGLHRLTLTGGFSPDSASQLAALLD